MSPDDAQEPSQLDRLVGAWLARMRESKGIAQVGLAEQLRRDQSYVSRVEGGHRRVTVREVFDWASALDAAWEEVAEGLRDAWERRDAPRSLWQEP